MPGQVLRAVIVFVVGSLVFLIPALLTAVGPLQLDSKLRV